MFEVGDGDAAKGGVVSFGMQDDVVDPTQKQGVDGSDVDVCPLEVLFCIREEGICDFFALFGDF